MVLSYIPGGRSQKVLLNNNPPQSLMKAKDLDEKAQIKLLNKCWKQASFGYPLNRDVLKPTSIAETLRLQSQKKLATPHA